MWDLPGPGLEPESPALAGRFLTTALPGKPKHFLYQCEFPLHTECLCPVLRAFPESPGSQWLSPHNNPYAKRAHFGLVSSGSLHLKPSGFPLKANGESP